jgi:hypothetical protein
LQTADSIGQARGKPADEMARLSRRGPAPAVAPVVETPEPEPEPVA